MVLLTARELAAKMRVSLGSIWVWRREGKIPPPVRLGGGEGAPRWIEEDIDAWIIQEKEKQNGSSCGETEAK